MTALVSRASAPLARSLSKGEGWLTGERHARYGFAAMRIGFGLVLLTYLIRNLPAASRVWGPGSAWLDPLRTQRYGWPFDLLRSWGTQPIAFNLWYIATLLAGVALLLGWRTRVVTPLLYVLFVGLIARNPVVTDNGDLAFRLLLIYTSFADTASVWSLDARRRARAAERRAVAGVSLPRWRRVAADIFTILHNMALIVIMFNLCLIYLAAGILKVQEPFWVDGTAIYYTLAIKLYQPWPALSAAVWWSGWGVTVFTYFTVLIEVFFPVLIIYRRTRRVAVVGVIAMHLGIAILMGLVSFSGFMAMVDTIIISTASYRRLEQFLKHRWQRLRGNRPKPAAGDGVRHAQHARTRRSRDAVASG